MKNEYRSKTKDPQGYHFSLSIWTCSGTTRCLPMVGAVLRSFQFTICLKWLRIKIIVWSSRQSQWVFDFMQTRYTRSSHVLFISHDVWYHVDFQDHRVGFEGPVQHSRLRQNDYRTSSAIIFHFQFISVHVVAPPGCSRGSGQILISYIFPMIGWLSIALGPAQGYFFT
jgi:hypothetical protein